MFDVGFRVGGGTDYRIVEKEKNINNVLNHLEYAINGEWTGDFSKCQHSFSNQYVTICVGIKNGTVGKISGINEPKKDNHVFDVIQYYYEGDIITDSGLYTQTIFRIS